MRGALPARLTAFGLVLALAFVGTWPTLLALHELWTDTGSTVYTHGYLIVAVVLTLIWRRREGLLGADWRPSPVGAVLLLLTSFMWLLSVHSSQQLPELAMWPLVILCAIHAVTGTASASQFVVPVSFLYFAIPLWDLLNSSLQWATVLAAQLMLRVLGVPAFFEGNVVRIPQGAFVVEGGCSGLHYLMVGLAMGALIGELRDEGVRGRIMLLVLAGLLAIVTNWIRVTSLILIGHATDMQHYFVAESHYVYGWALFALAMAAFVWLEPRVAHRAGTGFLGRAVIPAPLSTPVWSRKVAGISTVVTLLLVGSLHALMSRPAREGVGAEIPVLQGDLSGPYEARSAAWNPVMRGADSLRHAQYRTAGGHSYDLFVASYSHQQQGKEITGFGNHLDEDGSVVHRAYVVGGHVYSSPLRAGLGYALRALLGLRSPPASVVAVRAACETGCQRVGEEADQLLRHALDALGAS